MVTSNISHPYRSTIIFIVICLLCVISLLTETSSAPLKNAFKQAIYLITHPIVVGKTQINHFLDYTLETLFKTDYLKTENQTLKEEITRLKLAVINKAEKNHQLEQRLQTLSPPREWESLKLLHANILETYQGALRIDRGTKDGVQVSQGVIVPEGVVGLIIETSFYSSVVATLHHRECRIGGMIQRNRLRSYDGVIYPSGDLRKICTMNYIDIYDEVRVGDIVVTSPESIFPPGLTIGTIQAIHESGTLWKSADIIPSVDPYKLDEVFIIISKVEPLSIYEYNNSHISGENKDFETDKATTENTIQEQLAP